MSAIFTAPFGDNPVDYEIAPDGVLIIAGFDPEQDDMLTFMTGQRSDTRELFEAWERDQIAFVFRNFGLPMEVVLRFCLDIVKHILPIYQLQYGVGGPEEIICAEIQKWIDGGLPWPISSRDSLVDRIDALVAGVDRDRGSRRCDSLMEIEASIHALFALRTLVYTMVYFGDRPFNEVRRDLRNVSDKAFYAVEYRATYEEMLRPGYHGAISAGVGDRVQKRIVAEREWQVKRFVYAVNVHAEMGMWPPIDEVATWV